MLVKFGCEPISVRISHFKVRNPHNGKVSVVTIHTGKDFSKGAFVSTLKQLGIDVESFLVFIDKQ
ncbi:MAG: type II toxin-antitoxin system HicA family toxin [Clostridiales bacterium]|nr:type II toxin-antitoxin system HicA family toxin [Clostridiales bacterium]